MKYKLMYKTTQYSAWKEKFFDNEQEAICFFRTLKAYSKELWIKRRVGYDKMVIQ